MKEPYGRTDVGMGVRMKVSVCMDAGMVVGTGMSVRIGHASRGIECSREGATEKGAGTWI